MQNEQNAPRAKMAIGVWGGLPHTEEAAGSKAGGTRARGEMPRHLFFIFHPFIDY